MKNLKREKSFSFGSALHLKGTPHNAIKSCESFYIFLFMSGSTQLANNIKLNLLSYFSSLTNLCQLFQWYTFLVVKNDLDV